MTWREDTLAELIAEATPLPWDDKGIQDVDEFYSTYRSLETESRDWASLSIIGDDNDSALLAAAANALPAALDIIRAAREHAELMTAESREYLRSALAVWDKETT